MIGGDDQPLNDDDYNPQINCHIDDKMDKFGKEDISQYEWVC